MCLCLTCHQQLTSYEDGATVLCLIRHSGEAGDRTCDPWFTRQVIYPLHRRAAAPIYPDQTDRIGSVGSGYTLI